MEILLKLHEISTPKFVQHFFHQQNTRFSQPRAPRTSLKSADPRRRRAGAILEAQTEFPSKPLPSLPETSLDDFDDDGDGCRKELGFLQ